MGLPDVSVVALDGGLGIVPRAGAAFSAKLGVGSELEPSQVVVVGGSAEVPTKVGAGPLADACRDHFRNGGGPLVVCGAALDVPATFDVNDLFWNSISFDVQGNPTSAMDIVLEFLTGGPPGEATFRWRVNGGEWSEETQTPDDGEWWPLGDTGIEIRITMDAAGMDLTTEDEVEISAEPGLMSVESASTAIEALLASPHRFEFAHVVGASDAAFWTICNNYATEAALEKRWVWFLCEAPWPGADVDEWVTDMLTEASGFQSTRVAVVVAPLQVADPSAPAGVAIRNGAGVYSGRLTGIPIQRSPGRVIDGPVGAVGLWPALSDAQIAQLDAAGYVSFREYANTDAARGVFVTLGRMMAGSTSDYILVQLRRVMDRALWLVREAALPSLQGEADAAVDETPASLASFEAQLQQALNTMVASQQITAGTVTVPPGQDLLATQTLTVTVAIQPRGYLNHIEATIGFSSPVT